MKKLSMLLAVLLVLPLTARAYGTGIPEAVIPVSVQSQGPVREEGSRVELEALTPGCPMPAGSIGNTFCLELKDRGSIRILCPELGVYDYRVRQIPGGDPACSYDSREYRLRLYVTAEEGGPAVTALVYGQEAAKEPEILFRNRWAEPVRVPVSLLKTLDGKTPKDGAFSFRLLSEEGAVLQEVANLGRHVTFAPLEFDREGTWRYYIKEVSGTEGTILYDRTVYTLTVTVTLAGDFRADVSWERNGKAFTGTPAFANHTDTGLPKTGDSIGVWFWVLGLSAGGLGLLCVGRRRKKR